MKHISVVTQCYNEEGNIQEIYSRIKNIFSDLKGYSYEHIFIDNDSRDRTQEILRDIARQDRNIKVILNTRNFGQLRSPVYAMLQAQGDAVISIVSDMQQPPEMIVDFIKKWEEGYRIVVGVRIQSQESPILNIFKNAYYNLIGGLSDIKLIKNFTGFGLYDQEVIKIIRKLDDPLPYFRGLICEIGFERAEIPYIQPKRKWGITKNNFYILYDYAMLGITSHSKIPLRLATMLGFFSALLCFLVALGYLVYKLLFWNRFSLGIAPLVIGFFFFASMQMVFIGIIGEYVGSIHTQVLKRPMVIEKERINF
ncbi:MAG: glycosyltransferase family 2 protein [Candidatus Omnitrophica bacterium]|nr:glycosyltransferase family 2 protein [Candidatus Omnitrophota bacterium]